MSSSWDEVALYPSRHLPRQWLHTEPRQWLHTGIFIVNFEHISHPVLVFLLVTVNM